ncbi:MAG: SCO1664 family protein [Actinobacteria bacterium]|nr:SCO1664 family protein [Actinomycetota bacterium]
MTAPTGPLTDAVAGGATLDVLGRVAWSSNATFLVDVGSTARGIYKPVRGERPLGDFPPGIWQREIAAFELARTLGWDCVPETIEVDGPFGPGSLQRFVEDVDYDRHYFTLIAQDDAALDAQLRRLAVFDLIANNTDRKAGHCIIDTHDHVWGIDNALCFHADFKLRTVIWDFAGEPIDANLIDDVVSLCECGLPDALTGRLEPPEVAALLRRAAVVVRDGVFPHDPTGRRYPWPLI